MNFNKEKKRCNCNITNKINKNELYDYDINEANIIFNLDYSFPLRLDKIKLLIEVFADFTSGFFYFSYSIITKRVSILNIEHNLRNYFNIKDILKNVFDILKNELFITKRFNVEINKVDSENRYQYNIILRREENGENKYNYITEILVRNNNVRVFNASIVLEDNENMINFEKNMKILKLIFENFNDIKFHVIESIKDIVIREIELNIY